MIPTRSISTAALVIIAICVANVVFIGIAVVDRKDEERGTDSRRWKSVAGTVALSLAGASQGLYVLMLVAWVFAPTIGPMSSWVEGYSMGAGLVLAVSALAVALFGGGVRRWASIVAAIVVTFLWALFVVAAVAV
ncbi:MAG: hypothetical protein WA628_25870 [Terriglobales bacterium]